LLVMAHEHRCPVWVGRSTPFSRRVQGTGRFLWLLLRRLCRRRVQVMCGIAIPVCGHRAGVRCEVKDLRRAYIS